MRTFSIQICYNLDMKKIETVITKYGVFKAVFEPEPDMGGYVVEAPAVAGAISWGKNFADAKRMIAESIECAIEGDVILAAEDAGQVTLRRQRPVAFA